MSRFQIRYFISLAFLLLLFSSNALSSDIPKPVGYVNDFAKVLTSDTKNKLNRILVELKQKTGVEFAVVTIKTTKGEDIFDYSMKLFQQWGIGQKKEDNGILFLVSVKDRRLRINTGYGVEGILPDGLLGRIRDRYIIPYFKKGDYNDGILNGALAIVSVVAKAKNVVLNGYTAPKKLKRRGISLIDIILLIAAIFFIGPYFFPLMFGMFLGSYRSGWESPLGGGFGGGGLGGGFGGFGGGSSGGGGVGGGW